MIYFTSDQHFGHENIIKYSKRPFQNADEMDTFLISNWQRHVTDKDTVYILGDMFFRTSYDYEKVLKKLPGKKHLIIGNHDKNWMKKVDLSKYFASVQTDLIIENEHGCVYLCHCPDLEFYTDYMLYGHIHNNKEDEKWPVLKNMDNAMNVCVDINEYRPVTFDELVINNDRFRK